MASAQALASSLQFVKFLDELAAHELPPLPPTHAPLLQTALTHTSYYQQPHADFESADTPRDYERLEFIGDQIIGLAATYLITDTYPLLTVGASTSIKGALVSNSTLAEISRAYSLHTQLRAHPAQIAQLRNNLLVRAQLFEASVAAISTHQGLAPTLDWLKLLFQPLLTKLYEVAKEAHQAKLAGSRAAQMEAEVFVSYVAAVEMWRMKKGRAPAKVEYVKVRSEGPPHQPIHVGAITVDGVEQGRTSGAVWKDVKNELARQACDNLGIPY